MTELLIVGAISLITIGVLAYVVMLLLRTITTLGGMVKSSTPLEFTQYTTPPMKVEQSQPIDEGYIDIHNMTPEELRTATIRHITT